MMYAKSESDMVSLDPSSPRSPKRPVYYVQSPSRDSQEDGDKSSTAQPTPTDSPSHPSYARHSRASSSSRVSSTYRSSSASGRKGRAGRKSTDKRWADVIEEEDDFYHYEERKKTRRCQILIAVTGSVLIFSVFCLILWGASRRFKPEINVKKMIVHNFYIGQGTDLTGVPTKLFTINCSVNMNVYNPATFFGIHVSSMPVTLMYSELAVATGELNSYQTRRSHHFVAVNLQGVKVPLYGAGASLAVSNHTGRVPVRLVFNVRSRGNVVGELVKSRHQIHVSCSFDIDSHSNKPITFKKESCVTV